MGFVDVDLLAQAVVLLVAVVVLELPPAANVGPLVALGGWPAAVKLARSSAMVLSPVSQKAALSERHPRSSVVCLLRDHRPGLPHG